MNLSHQAVQHRLFENMLWVAHRPDSYITWDAQKLSTMHAVQCYYLQLCDCQAVQHWHLHLNVEKRNIYCSQKILLL